MELQLRGYVTAQPRDSPDRTDTAEKADDRAEVVITEHLFRYLRGQDNLVFANARSAVELYADLLARRSSRDGLPNEFWPHHGNLSKSMREAVEAHLKDSTRPATAVCTSTLELGIDIGSVTSVAQIGPPPSVAASDSAWADQVAVTTRPYCACTSPRSNSTSAPDLSMSCAAAWSGRSRWCGSCSTGGSKHLPIRGSTTRRWSNRSCRRSLSTAAPPRRICTARCADPARSNSSTRHASCVFSGRWPLTIW